MYYKDKRVSTSCKYLSVVNSIIVEDRKSNKVIGVRGVVNGANSLQNDELKTQCMLLYHRLISFA